jgi:hypothetical protein
MGDVQSCGAPHATDKAIVDRTDEITALMFGG